MPRKGHIAKRDVLVDPIYNSKLVTRLINKIMLDGKKPHKMRILCLQPKDSSVTIKRLTRSERIYI